MRVILALAAAIAFIPPLSAQSLRARFTQAAEDAVARQLTPGIAIGLYTRGRASVVVTRGVGDLATNTPFRARDWHRIGSVTKTFTVTRIYQLAEDGRLSLSDPISKYVPGLRNGDATLRQLANMTSGIFNYTENRRFTTRLFRDPGRRYNDRQLVAAGNRRPYFAPGRGWHYSNTNTVLLGMVVEIVTGNSLGSEIRRHILAPLGLRRTAYPNTPAMPSPFHRGYVFDSDDNVWLDFTRLNPTSLAGSGAIIGTLGDLARWGRALARGTLLSPESQADRLRMVAARGVGPFYNRYGPGIGMIGGWIGHTGDLPGYQTLVMHNRRTDQTLVIFINAQVSGHLPTVIFRRLLRDLPSAR